MKITSNSVEGQLTQLDKHFLNVEATAKSYETLNGKAVAILHNALEQIYTFGDTLLSLRATGGISIVREFLLSHNIPYNSRTQANPYIGLVKLAFKDSSDSSRSQYATVLAYAGTIPVAPSDFISWLTEDKKGIEGRRSEALDAQNSKGRAIRNQGRVTRVQHAENVLLSRPLSKSVLLPAGLQAPEGFALVLARIDGNNGAQIVDVVHTDPAKVEPILLNLVQAPAALSDEPLAPFFRAIDLILSATPDTIDGKDRNVLVQNKTARGKKSAIVQAVSDAYNYPGAIVTLADHVGSLPVDEVFILTGRDAKSLLDQSEKLTIWTLDKSGALGADGLLVPITMQPIASGTSLNLAQAQKTPNKPLKTLSTDFQEVLQYLESGRNNHAHRNAERGDTRAFPSAIELSIKNNKLGLKLPDYRMFGALGETGANTDFDGKTLAVKDLENLAKAFAKYDVDAHGWIMDGEVDDAAIVLEAHIENDLFRAIMPTRTGNTYNKVCKAVVI